MRHTIFALFPNHAEADLAIQEIAGLAPPERACEVVVHDHAPLKSEDLQGAETGSLTGTADGLLYGAALGALVAALVFRPLGFMPFGVVGCLFVGGILGGMLGAYAIGLALSSCPDANLDELAHRLEGDAVLVAIEGRGLTMTEQAEQIALRHRALVKHKRHL